MIGDPTAFGDLIQHAADVIDAAADAPRAEVIRTKLTAERDPIPDPVRAIVLRRDKYRCVWCGSRSELQMDHIIPWSAGGADTADNLRTLCRECNETRSNRFSVFDIEEQVHHGMSCLRCDPRDRLDDMDVIWCETCKARGVGYGREPRAALAKVGGDD